MAKLRNFLFTLGLVFSVLLLASCEGGSSSGDGSTDNHKPVADARTVTLDEDNPSNITLTGSDLDGDSFSFIVLQQPSHCSLSGSAPNLIYSPDADFNGSDSFTYKVNDGALDSNIATITLTINPVNDAPTADNLNISVLQNSNTAVILSGSDVEGAALTYTVQSQPGNGTLSGNAPNLTYTPDNGFHGSDSFTYTSNDGDQDSLIATVSISIIPTITLNDTGITYGANYPTGNNASCIGETVTEQDCSHGRDATHNDDSDGHAGFSYTKLDTNGNDLPASATSWSCVRDNVTGLIWEVKTDDGGLHDTDWSYTWYNSSGINDGGGYTGSPDGGVCGGTVAAGCDTEKFVAAVNSAGLCGAHDWRLPNRMELISLANLNRIQPSIDIEYFPNTQSGYITVTELDGTTGSYSKAYYWTSSPSVPYGALNVWTVDFNNGFSQFGGPDNDEMRVRLVRSE